MVCCYYPLQNGSTDYAGLHLSPAGYDIFFQEVMKLIAQKWPDQMPEKLPMVLPPWDDMEAWKAWEAATSSR
jgi:hypothetical protein